MIPFGFNFKSGVTLVELLVTVGIALALLALTVSSLSFNHPEDKVKNTQVQISNLLQTAYTYAMTSKRYLDSSGARQVPEAYGVFLSPAAGENSYVFVDVAADGSFTVGTDLKFYASQVVLITPEISISATSGADVLPYLIFKTKKSDQTGEVSLLVEADNCKAEVALDKSTGIVNLTEVVCS